MIDKVSIEVKLLNTSLIDNTFDYQEVLNAKKQISNHIYLIQNACEKINQKGQANDILKNFFDYEEFIDLNLKSGDKYKNLKIRMNRDSYKIINSLDVLKQRLL